MTPLEDKLLQRLGVDNLRYTGKLSIFVFFYGVYAVLFSASVVIFARKGFSNRATAAMFVTTVINFIFSSLSIVTQVAGFTVFIRKAMVVDIYYPFLEKPALVNNALRGVNILAFWAGNLPIWLTDLIVIWRAWVLFPDRQWVILLPFILWIGTVGLTVGNLIWLSIPSNYDQWTSKLDFSLSLASYALSIATNAVTTMLIAYRLWCHRKLIAKTLGLGRRKSPVQTVLSLLVESGLVFLAFQIVYLALTADGTPPAINFEEYAFSAVYLSLSAMYPTVVMILVETQRSMPDVCEISPSNASRFAGRAASDARPATFGHLSFAVEPVHSTMDNEVESQRSRALQSQGGQERGLEELILEVKESQVVSSA